MKRVLARLRWLVFFFYLSVLTAFAASAQNARQAEAMSRAMTALRAGDWDTAQTEARGAGQTGRDIIEWHRLRDGRIARRYPPAS